MNAKLDLPVALFTLVEAWARPQSTLPKVIRWKKYQKRGTRRQDTLQHSFSIALFAIWLFPQLRRYVKFDEYFVLSALILHDIGEGELGNDTLYMDKTHSGDDVEASAFLARYRDIFGEITTAAYLLQYAGKATHMPTHTKMLELLEKQFPTERLVFEAVERFDYLLYAFEQYFTRQKAKILVHVLRNQWPKLEDLAVKIPGLAETLWMHEIGAWRESFLKQHEGKWIEQKGER